jgi:hypothetical protein
MLLIMDTESFKNETINNYSTVTNYTNLTLFLIGIICNSICVYIFLQNKMRIAKFNWYLLVLAIVELIFCIILFVDYSFQLLNEKKLLLHQCNKILNVIFDYCVHTLDSYASVITLILSIDRLYAIQKPLKIKFFVTNLHVKLFIFTSLLSILILRIPLVILCTVEDISKYHEGFSICSIATPIIFNFIPTFLILIINSLLIRQIVKTYKNNLEERVSVLYSTQSRKSTLQWMVFYKNSSHNSSVSINRLNAKPISKTQKSHYFVIIISSCWLVFSTFFYYTISSFNLIKFSKQHDLVNEQMNFNLKHFNTLQNIFSIIFNSNHCINFFFYFSFYSMFRDSLCELFSKVLRLKIKRASDCNLV